MFKIEFLCIIVKLKSPCVHQHPMLTSELINIYNEFETFVNNRQETNLDIEQKKLRRIQLIYNSIMEQYGQSPEDDDIEDKENDYSSSFNYILYNSLVITSLFKHSLSSFLFGITLLELIPGLSHIQSTIISILYTLLDSIIFYAIEISYLKKALNIHDDTDAVCELLETYIVQLKLVRAINQELASGNAAMLEKDQYKAYLDCIALFNEDIKNKFSKIKDYQDSSLKCIIKNIIVFIGAISKIAGSYFIAKSLLMTLAASLVGTPLGFIFIATIIFGGVGFFYVLGEHSVSKLMNPEMDGFNKLKQNFIRFENELPKHQNACNLNQRFFRDSVDDTTESLLNYQFI